MKKTYRANVVLPDKILYNGFLSVEGGIITRVSTVAPENGEITELGGYLLAGFIDIHCHANADLWAQEDPQAVAEYHLAHGTTGMLLTFYRDIPHEKLLSALNAVKRTMKIQKNILGAHLEGPYLNSTLGSGSNGLTQDYPKREVYSEYAKTGVVKQWTCAPEVKGADKFIRDVSSYGIVPAVGHSAASYADVKAAFNAGAKIVTHIFDATGTTIPENHVEGTEEVSFDEACMLMPDMFYEVICDKNWVHVRREKLDLLIKTVGKDRVICITDSCVSGGDPSSDINLVRQELSGSKLTMDKVAKNLFDAGFGFSDITKFTAFNAAKALSFSDAGELAVGKKADMVLLSDKAELLKTITSF